MAATATAMARGAMLKGFARYRWRVARARRHMSEFGPLVTLDHMGNAIEYSNIHLSWVWHLTYCWNRKLHCALLAPFGHGKCQPAGEPVQLADGSAPPIEGLSGQTFRVLAFDPEDYTFRPAEARCFPNGARPVIRLTLRSGRVREVTHEHPMLTVLGWKLAANVRVGDAIGVARELPQMGTKKMRPGEAAMLGYLVGDGCCVRDKLDFTNGEPALIEDFERRAAGLGFGHRIGAGPGCQRVALSGGARRWAREHGIYGAGSRTKRTPPALFRAPEPDVADYLRAYYACDGTVTSLRGGAVELYSVNRGLLADVQSLLLRFGVRAVLRAKRGRYKGERHDSWRLILTGADSLRTFRERVGIFGEKGRKLAAMPLGRRTNANLDTVPIEYRGLQEKTAHWHKVNTGVSLDQASKRGTTREVVARAALAEGNRRLLQVSAGPVSWDEVVLVEDAGVKETYGIEVPGLRTYVTGDVVVHNSSGFAVPLLTWLVGQNPQYRIKVVSAGDQAAAARVEAAKQIIESPRYREVFPKIEVGRKWTNHEAFVKRKGEALDPTIHARGVETKGMGGRADFILFDDVVDDMNSMELEQRNKIKRYVHMKWMSRLHPETGRALWLATPWHVDDATHELMGMKGWCLLRQPVAQDLMSYEQEVYGAGPDYADEVRAMQAEYEAAQESGL